MSLTDAEQCGHPMHPLRALDVVGLPARRWSGLDHPHVRLDLIAQ